MSLGEPAGVTIQLWVGEDNGTAARSWYESLFGRAPDFRPSGDESFCEWIVKPGFWEIHVVAREPAGSQQGRLRLATTDVVAARERVQALGVPVDDVEELPDVVRYCDFDDPWGNRLGLYQDLSRWPATPWMAALSAHIHRFNTAVRSGDWAAFVATFADDAIMRINGDSGGALRGRGPIGEAYRVRPPDDTMHLRSARLDGDRIVAAFGWDGGTGGTLTLRLAGREVAELGVTFDGA